MISTKDRSDMRIVLRCSILFTIGACLCLAHAPDADTAGIVFLKQYAGEISRPAAQDVEVRQIRATRIGLNSADLAAPDNAARVFNLAEAALRDEALRYHADLRAAGKGDDPVQVRAFTTRRAQLAQDAAAQIQNTLAHKKYTVVEEYVRKLGASVTLWK
jgi:hypothetical protein